MTMDRSRMEALLAPDFTFTSPYDDHIDRATYFERCWPAAGSFESLDIRHLAMLGDRCFVLYDGKSHRGKLFRNTELFTIANRRIRSVEVFFGLPPGGPVQKASD
nr:nuclear transport factor 2 family protein [Pararhizobium capsulatum]